MPIFAKTLEQHELWSIFDGSTRPLALLLMLWIPLTLAAAFFQNLRSALQRQLKSELSDLGAASVRFLYALPFALVWLALVTYLSLIHI